MEKKLKAKSDMLKLLSKEMSDDQHSPLKEKLAGKQMSKVTVMSDSPKGLAKGLSKAEEILKKRDSMLSPLESEKDCKDCKGSGCPLCEAEESPEKEDEMEDESEAEEIAEEDMSKEEIMEMMKALEAKLAKLS